MGFLAGKRILVLGVASKLSIASGIASAMHREGAELALTYLGEVVWGRYQRPFSGNETNRLAWYHELAWHPVNGIVLRLRYDTFDPDGEVRDDVVHRPGLGLDWHVVSGFSISADGRLGLPSKGGAGEGAADVFVQLHGWF